MELSQDCPGSHACPYTHRHKCRQRCRHAQTELLQRCKYVCIHTYTWPALWVVVVVGVAACGHAGKETRRWNMLEEDMLDGSMGVSGGGAELCAVYHVSHRQENSIESTVKSRSLSAFLKVGFIHVF